ncbi:unnamed protein product [Closterium sp. Naga37s-1]|nr:unnamed protein product [Closterium sp. Naga37s-1]
MSRSASRHFRSAAGALRHCLKRTHAASSAPSSTPVPASAVLATRHPHEPSICCTSIDPAVTRTSSSISCGFSIGDASPGDTWHRSNGSFHHGLTPPYLVFPAAIAARAVSFSTFHSSPATTATAAAADVAASGASGEKAQPPASTLLPTSGAPVVSPLVAGASPLSPASPTGRTVRAVLAGLKQNTPKSSTMPSLAPCHLSHHAIPRTMDATMFTIAWRQLGPKKVNLVAAMVRGMTPDDALMQMAVSIKRAAKTVAKVITAAKANAVHNHGLEGEEAYYSGGVCGQGPISEAAESAWEGRDRG